MADHAPARPLYLPRHGLLPLTALTTLPPAPLLSSYFIVRSKCLPYCNKMHANSAPLLIIFSAKHSLRTLTHPYCPYLCLKQSFIWSPVYLWSQFKVSKPMGEHHQPILHPQLSDPSTISLPSGTSQRRAHNHLPTWNRNRIDGKIPHKEQRHND